MKIEGTVAPGYEAVREVFEKQFRDSRQENAQVCAYVAGEKVVDLWGTHNSSNPDGYDGDTIQTVFSSTKSITAIVFAHLVDQGLLNYSDKVSKHWPEFGQKGKEDLKVEDILRHEGGLAKWVNSIKDTDTLRENIKANAVGAVIAEEEAAFPNGQPGTREYHGLTRGWVLNEIFRRIHPEGKTVGEHLRDAMAGPLGADVYIGAPDGGERNATLKAPSNAYLLFNGMLPAFISNRVEVSTVQMVKVGIAMARMAKNSQEDTTRNGFPMEGVTKDKVKPHNVADFLDTAVLRRGETPSTNGSCSARGLARLGAAVVNGGELDGVRILSQEAVDKMHDNVVTKKNVSVFSLHSNFTQGGVNVFKVNPSEASNPILSAFNGLREGFVGWQGFGGSVFQWHPELNISFAFVPTWLAWYDAVNARGGELQQALVQCVQKKKENES